MSKNVKVNGVDYTGVSQVQLPTTAGGTALFKDVDEITTPSGSINITENGTHNVSAYAQAVVNVASGGDNENMQTLVKLFMERPKKLTEETEITVPNYVTAFSGFGGVAGDGSARLRINLPDTIEVIDGGALSYSPNLSIGKLPGNLRIIRGNAFQYARNAFDGTELEIPASVEEIASLAFYTYNGPVNTVTFKGTPTSIASNAFQDCSIRTVNVPWAEGAVANAPWGAGTVNYNYTGA